MVRKGVDAFKGAASMLTGAPEQADAPLATAMVEVTDVVDDLEWLHDPEVPRCVEGRRTVKGKRCGFHLSGAARPDPEGSPCFSSMAGEKRKSLGGLTSEGRAQGSLSGV